MTLPFGPSRRTCPICGTRYTTRGGPFCSGCGDLKRGGYKTGNPLLDRDLTRKEVALVILWICFLGAMTWWGIVIFG